MSDPTVEDLLEELQDLLAGVPPEARPVVIKMAMEHVIHRYEQLMPLAPTGVEKEQIEMAKHGGPARSVPGVIRLRAR